MFVWKGCGRGLCAPSHPSATILSLFLTCLVTSGPKTLKMQLKCFRWIKNVGQLISKHINSSEEHVFPKNFTGYITRIGVYNYNAIGKLNVLRQITESSILSWFSSCEPNPCMKFLLFCILQSKLLSLWQRKQTVNTNKMAILSNRLTKSLINWYH